MKIEISLYGLHARDEELTINIRGQEKSMASILRFFF